jgi:hypothetical protein
MFVKRKRKNSKFQDKKVSKVIFLKDFSFFLRDSLFFIRLLLNEKRPRKNSLNIVALYWQEFSMGAVCTVNLLNSHGKPSIFNQWFLRWNQNFLKKGNFSRSLPRDR